MSLLVRNVCRSLVGSRIFTRTFSTKQNAPREFLRMIATFSLLGRLFSRQANVYLNDRIRRANQLYMMYQRTPFGRAMFDSFFQNLIRQATKRRPTLFAAAAAIFSFVKEGIEDSDIERCLNEFHILKHSSQLSNCIAKTTTAEVSVDKFAEYLTSEGYDCIVDSDHLHIWRKSEPGLTNYKYKVYGKFTDISAKSFFAVQCDMDYRKKWDKLVVELDIVDKDENNEVIYWQMRYPFPMKARDYVFIRRSYTDTASGCMVVISHATDHPSCPPRDHIVRVTQYVSDMVISPHGSADEDGFDYLLTYYDDPQSSFPSPVYAWMAASGVHDYVDKLHKATKAFGETVPAVFTESKRFTPPATTHAAVHLKQYA